MTIIKVAGLTKDYRVRRKQQESNGLLTKARSIISPPTDKLRALKAVNFEVEEGEFLGYIGPNGSGKSTTIKLMTGVLTPTEGTATIMGYVPWKQRKEYTRNIGVIFGSHIGITAPDSVLG
ncbi:MAG: ATP-binding cassette domain-containing protein [Candidatus Hodarchaeales archaeon]|jgi:ABC-2 type transport system ATP-binding protein